MTIRYVPHYRVRDYLALGWMVEIPAVLCHHDWWSVPMRWACACKIVEPT